MLPSTHSTAAKLERRAEVVTPYAWPTLVIVGLFTSIVIAAVLFGTFTVAVGDLAPLYALAAAFVACGWAARRRPLLHVADFLQITGLFYLVAASGALSCSVLTSTGLPYRDDALEAADRAIGFDWNAMIHSFQSHPWFASALSEAYITLNWQPQLAIVLLSVLRPPLARYQFLTAWAVCLFLTALIYPFFPAIAAFHHYGIDPASLPAPTTWVSWNLPELMEQLRSGSDRVLDKNNLTGLVTMPSFHAAAAVILLWTFWSFRFLRWPFVALNLLMFASAIPVGGHYLVDTLAGLLLAVIAICFAVHLHTERPAKARLSTATLRPALSLS